MKNSSEWISDIHEKAEERFAQQKKRRKMIVSISSSAACLALVLCSVIAVLNLIDNNLLTISSKNIGTNQTLDNAHHNNSLGLEHSDAQITAPPSSKENLSESSSIEDNGKRLLATNKIINRISAAPKYRDPKEHYKELWSEKQINEYLGINLAKLSLFMPVDLVYAQKDEFRMLFHNSGDIAEDYQSFFYEGVNNRKVKVSVSKIATPYDCVYELETADKTFVVSTEVLFGVLNNNKDSSEYDFCYADFESNGLSYRVEADNLTLKELYKIVEGIVGLK